MKHGTFFMTAIADEDMARARKVLGRAIKAFEVTIEALDAAVDRLREDVTSGEQEVMKDLRAMNGAFLFAMTLEEKARAAEFGTGGGGAGQLDLDAAREEIGLRLACLRAAGGDRAVPGEPE